MRSPRAVLPIARRAPKRRDVDPFVLPFQMISGLASGTFIPLTAPFSGHGLLAEIESVAARIQTARCALIEVSIDNDSERARRPCALLRLLQLRVAA
jgi:hypothetical protein